MASRIIRAATAFIAEWKAPKDKTKPRKAMRQVSKKKQAYRNSEAGRIGREHMAKVAALPCVICENHGFKQVSRTEVHHCKSGRYGNLRESDMMTIPLCHGHHNKLRIIPGEEHFIGFHNSQPAWEANYGRDYDYVSQVMDMIEKGRG